MTPISRLARRAARFGIERARDLLEHRVVILAYHTVGDVTADPFALFVSTQNFEEQAEVIARSADVLSLSALPELIERRRLPRRALVITFDDGYCGSVDTGGAVLARRGLASTVFLTSEVIGAGRELWWDQLEQLFLLPGELPDSIDVAIGGTRLTGDLGDCASYPAVDASRHSGWLANSAERPTMRHFFFRRAYDLMRPLSGSDRSVALSSLWTWAGRSPVCRPSHAIVSRSDARRLAASGSIEFGGHTASHPVLSALTVEEQAREVRDGKAVVEEILGQAVSSFAYPYGGGGDFTADTMTAVREAGFKTAVSTSPQPVTGRSDLFSLPRRTVKNWNGRDFESRLRQWLR